jgi:hypothetical protein
VHGNRGALNYFSGRDFNQANVYCLKRAISHNIKNTIAAIPVIDNTTPKAKKTPSDGGGPD